MAVVKYKSNAGDLDYDYAEDLSIASGSNKKDYQEA